MTKEEYQALYMMYFEMETPALQQAVTDLYRRKFIHNDIEAYNTHRIAARVLLEREHTGESLVYHMKDFLR